MASKQRRTRKSQAVSTHLQHPPQTTQAMNRLYIIDPTNFSGQIVNSMTSKEGTPQFVDYMKKPTTFEEYKVQKDNPNLVAIEWEEFKDKYYIPYLNSLCGEFKESTEEAFWYALECLPPKRWTSENGNEFFFLGECYTADLYNCHVRIGDKYYSALRPINTPKEDIFNLK